METDFRETTATVRDEEGDGWSKNPWEGGVSKAILGVPLSTHSSLWGEGAAEMKYNNE